MSELDNDKGFLSGNFSDFGAPSSPESWQAIADALPQNSNSKKRGFFFFLTGIFTLLGLSYLMWFNFSYSTINFDFKQAEFASSNKTKTHKTNQSTSKKLVSTIEIKPIHINLADFSEWYKTFNLSHSYTYPNIDFTYQFPFNNFVYSNNTENQIDKLHPKALLHEAESPNTWGRDVKIKRKNNLYLKLQSLYGKDWNSMNELFSSDSSNAPVLDNRLSYSLSLHKSINYRFSIGAGILYGSYFNQFNSRNIEPQNPYYKVQHASISLHPEWTILRRNRFSISAQFSPEFSYFFTKKTKQYVYPVELTTIDAFNQSNVVTTNEKIHDFYFGMSGGLDFSYWINSHFKIHANPQVSKQFKLTNQIESNYRAENLKYGIALGLSYHF